MKHENWLIDSIFDIIEFQGLYQLGVPRPRSPPSFAKRHIMDGFVDAPECFQST